jgi:DNA invertase Pin-like site-specific DNA recombinase
MNIGYVRVSKGAARATEQGPRLLAADSDEIIEEADDDNSQPALASLIEHLGPNDTLIVTSLDRLAMSLPQLIKTLQQLTATGVQLRSVEDQFDSAAPQSASETISRIAMALIAADRVYLIERTQAGRTNAKHRGVRLGRKPKLTSDQVAHARQLLNLGEGGRSVARTFGISEATLYRVIRNLPR